MKQKELQMIKKGESINLWGILQKEEKLMKIKLKNNFFLSKNNWT